MRLRCQKYLFSLPVQPKSSFTNEMKTAVLILLRIIMKWKIHFNGIIFLTLKAFNFLALVTLASRSSLLETACWGKSIGPSSFIKTHSTFSRAYSIAQIIRNWIEIYYTSLYLESWNRFAIYIHLDTIFNSQLLRFEFTNGIILLRCFFDQIISCVFQIFWC